MGNDIPGERKLLVGLTQIKGIGHNFATAIASTLKINTNSNIGHLTDANVQEIEKLITNPRGRKFRDFAGQIICKNKKNSCNTRS